jgi:hypothetical protein
MVSMFRMWFSQLPTGGFHSSFLAFVPVDGSDASVLVFLRPFVSVFGVSKSSVFRLRDFLSFFAGRPPIFL